jgi:hypothetical protein
MEYSEKELDLARRYNNGDYNEIQFNFLVVQNKLNRERMDSLIEKLGYEHPLKIATKFVIACMLIHFAACLFYSILHT